MSFLSDKVKSLESNWSNIPQSYDDIPAEWEKQMWPLAEGFIKVIGVEIGDVLKLDSEDAAAYFETLKKPTQDRISAAIDRLIEVISEVISLMATRRGTPFNAEQGAGQIRQLSERLTKQVATHSEPLYTFIREVAARQELNKLVAKLDQKIQDTEPQLEALKKAQLEATKAKEQLDETTLQSKETEGQLEKKTAKAATFVLSEANLEECNTFIDAHEKAAKRWLIAGIIAVVALIRVLIWMFGNDKFFWFCGAEFPSLAKDASLAQSIVFAVTKILFVSFSVGLCILISRTFQSHTHNVLVFRQRKLAWAGLRTLLAVMENADQSDRREVIKQATRTIFAQTNTGFLDNPSSAVRCWRGKTFL